MIRFKKIADNIKLSSTEKQKMRNELLAFMRENPAKADQYEKYALGYSDRTFGSVFYLFRSNRMRMASAFVMILLLIGGGVSYAAEGALPGDVLYSVKVSLNEPILTAMASSAKEKASVAVKLAVRRLEEVEALATGKKLDFDTEDILTKQFEAFADKADEHSVKLAERTEDRADAAELSTRLEVALNAHEQILSKIIEKETASSSKIVKVKEKVRSRIDRSVMNRINVEAKVGTDPREEAFESAKKRLKSAENALIEAEKKYIEQKSEQVNGEQKMMYNVETETELDAAKEKLIEGKMKLEANNSAEAFSLFGDADRGAEGVKLKLDLETNIRLGSEQKRDEIEKEKKSSPPTKGTNQQVDDLLDPQI
ncbi:MAG: hypothetical protein HZA95_00045 [Candidatus Vogelbacteria bacterium]|nr:hypothetical protein [Candidatus Vogelbacteria bacterium]